MCFRYCKKSPTLCEYSLDRNNILLSSELKNITWPVGNTSTTEYKRMISLMKNLIIVRLRYVSSEIEMTVLDSRATLSDKIAKLGGTFGIWVQLTGCTLLVLINVFLLAMKIGFKTCIIRRRWNCQNCHLWELKNCRLYFLHSELVYCTYVGIRNSMKITSWGTSLRK